MKFTCADLSDRLGVTKVVANGLARHLVAVGLAKELDAVKKVADGKNVAGRPTAVYEVTGTSITLDLANTAPVSYETGTRKRKTKTTADAA